MTLWYGVDIGGTSAKTALIDDKGKIVAKRSFDTGFGAMPQEVAKLAKDALHLLLQEAGRDESEVRGAGFGIPGFLDANAGVVIEAVNLGWNNVAFTSLFQKVLGIPVKIENDANLAALGEAWAGAGRGHAVVVVATVGTGVGAGIVIDGKLHRGVNGVAGEIGHLVVKREGGYLCNCGHYGCLETVASASAIVRNAKARQERGDLPKDVEITEAKDVFELAERGLAAADEVVREAAHFLGYGMSLVAVTLNPDAIVIGGGVSRAQAQFLNPMVEAFNQYSLSLVVEAANIRAAMLANDAGVIGAARLAQQGVQSDLSS